MDILLDTHAFIWYVEGNERLSLKAHTEISDPQNDKFISIASLWEIVIKISKINSNSTIFFRDNSISSDKQYQDFRDSDESSCSLVRFASSP